MNMLSYKYLVFHYIDYFIWRTRILEVI